MAGDDPSRPVGAGAPPPTSTSPGPADPDVPAATEPVAPLASGGVVDPGTEGDSFSLSVVGGYPKNEKAFLALLSARGLAPDKVLFRGFSADRLESVLYFGTDHPEKDSVYAYDPREFIGADPGLTHEIDPFAFDHIVIYDKSKLSRGSEDDLYRFNDPGKKSEAVLLVIDLKRTEPIDRHRTPTPPARPQTVEISPSLLPPVDSRRLLEEGQILRLALRIRRESVAPHIIRYTHLGDVYDYEAPKYVPTLKEPGIRTWEDLKAFIETAVFNSGDGESIEVEIDQYLFPTLRPPADFLAEIHDLAKQNRLRPITLVVKGDPMEPPVVYRFTPDGIRSSLVEDDAEARSFWTNREMASVIAKHLEKNPAERMLLMVLNVAHRKDGAANLGRFLDRVIALYNATAEPADQIPLDKRSEIFLRLEGLRKKLVDKAMREVRARGLKTPPAAFYWDPATTILRHHPVNPDPKNCWYSIGAGQMIATLEFTRKLIDRGVLPLDFRLIADNRSDAGVWELSEHGTRFQNLGTNQVNTPNRRQIYVLGSRQREEALLTYRPLVVLFNVKASDLPSIMRGRLLEIFKLIHPVMSMPVKAYGSEKLILFLEIYGQLKKIDPELAERFYVMGGFFEAPKILQGRRVDITIAGGNEDGLKTLARGLSPTSIDPVTGKADWEFLNLKLIPDVAVATALYCGGANKNFLTYRSGRLLMREVLALPPHAAQPDKDRLGQRLEEEKQRNIQIGEEVTARITAPYGITTYHLWSSFGLEQDFRNSLPPDLGDLYTIRDRLAPILASGDFVQLEALITEIQLSLGRGTRNARDGYIDEILAIAFEHFQKNDRLPVGVTWETFYEAYYPRKWQGTGAQEGRNGIGPIIRFAQRNKITLPREVLEAWNLYNPSLRISEAPMEQTREYLLPSDEELIRVWGIGHAQADGFIIRDADRELNPLWGLPQGWVRRLARYIGRLNSVLAETVTGMALGDIALDKREISRSIAHLVGILRPIEEREGKLPEVTRRLVAIRERATALVDLLNGEMISEDRLQSAVRVFKETVEKTLSVFVEAKTVTELLSHLRHVAINLFRVELEVRRELKVKLGLGREVPRADTKSPAPKPAPVPGGPGTTVVIGAIVATGDGSEDPNAPKAMLRGVEMFDGSAALDLTVIPAQSGELGRESSLGDRKRSAVIPSLRIVRDGSPPSIVAHGGDDRREDIRTDLQTRLRDTLIRHAAQRGLKEVAAFLVRLNDDQITHLVKALGSAGHGSTGSPCPSRTEHLFAAIATRIGANDELARIVPGRVQEGTVKGNSVTTLPVPAATPLPLNPILILK